MSIIEVGIHPKFEGRARVHQQYGDTHIIHFLPQNYTREEEEKAKRWVESLATLVELGPELGLNWMQNSMEEK